MMRTFLVTSIATLVAITWGIMARGDVAYGGEMIIPILAGAYTVIVPGKKRSEK